MMCDTWEDRDYDGYTAMQLDGLKKDLSFVAKDKLMSLPHYFCTQW
jgi:hypothetical protein